MLGRETEIRQLIGFRTGIEIRRRGAIRFTASPVDGGHRRLDRRKDAGTEISLELRGVGDPRTTKLSEERRGESHDRAQNERGGEEREGRSNSVGSFACALFLKVEVASDSAPADQLLFGKSDLARYGIHARLQLHRIDRRLLGDL